MITECIDCGNPRIEANDRCASCNHRQRRLAREEAKPIKTYKIPKASPKQHAINAKYSKSLKERYQEAPKQICAGCGEPATCTAHIIAKSRLKVIGRPELIHHPKASFPSCYACNTAIENPKGQAWKGLANIEECLEFIKQHDTELHRKFMVNL
jgi:hypothetical protein